MASHHRHHLTAGHHLLLFLLLVTALYASAQSSNNNNNNNNNNNQYFPNTNFNPSMAIVIIVLISAFFFLGFFSIYIRQCAGDRLNPRLSSSTTTTAATAARSRRQRGLDPELLQTFPTLVYSEVKGLKIGKESLECAVCLSEFEDDETLRLLPKCSHVFHPDCIDAWLAAHVTCPVCRCNLTESDEKTNKNDALTTETSPEQLVELPTTEQQQQEEMTSIQIDQDDESRAEMENLERFVNLKRARSQARPVNFPRSHSTGHSLVQPGQNLDRFTLRLPEDIRKEIVAANLQRTTSCSVAFRREASTRRGYTEGSLGRGGRSIRLGRSDRWGSFLSRTLSLKNWGRRGEPEMGSGSVKAVRFNGVMGPLGGNSSVEGKEDEVSSTAALNNV